MIWRLIKSLWNWRDTYHYAIGQWNQGIKMKQYKKHLRKIRSEGVQDEI